MFPKNVRHCFPLIRVPVPHNSKKIITLSAHFTKSLCDGYDPRNSFFLSRYSDNFCLLYLNKQ